jgi:uncharacterized protein YodC (DUF2158 family)
MPDEIKAGDVVQLKSGSPRMTANWVEKGEASCSWFDDKNKEHTSVFPVTSLKRVE